MFAAGGILPWHQAQPGRELAPTAEAARFYHRGGDGCGDDRADARTARPGIVLVALDVRLHVLRRHQSHLVAKRAQLPPPVVRRRARLQANSTGRQSTEERQNLRTPKLLAQNRRSLRINPVHLKNMLRQVQSDRSNLAHGWLPFAAVSIRQQFGTQMPQGGHPPHHSITSSATASSVGGISTPNAFAVARLMTSSNLVPSSTGRSPGFSPLR